MWVLACCDKDGRCFGFLGKNNEVIVDERQLNEEYLMTFKRKSDTSEIVLRVNIGHLLLENGAPYRVVPVKM